MNFLAHLFLTQGDEDLTIGNFIADSVRKSQWSQYSSKVQDGIKIHHRIDSFTDSHLVVEKTKIKLRPKHGKYSPVIGDIIYDHFLARNFSDYADFSVEEFAAKCYRLFHKRESELPQSVQHMFYYMEKGNWLVNYKSREGLNSALSGMSRRASFDNKMDEATADVFNNYESFESDFKIFFPELQHHIKTLLKTEEY